MNSDFLPPTIRALRALITAGQLSPLEAVRAQARRLRDKASHYRCITHAYEGVKDARSGLLAGVGLAHKDIFYTNGRMPGCGAPSQVDALPSLGSAGVLRILEQAGAANLAALAMSEFACGATGQSRLQQPVNPLNPDLVVGGSSSGSAVAVAAGICYASLGTDTAGSVRIPAATCGVLGLKMTRGALSTEGVFPLAPSLDTVGILARSAMDAAYVLGALNEGVRRNGSDKQLDKALADSPPARVAVAIPFDDLDHDIAHALEDFVIGLEAHKARSTSVPELDAMNRCAQLVLHAEAAHTHWHRIRNAPESLSATTLSILEPGVAVPALWHLEALARRDAHRNQLVSECFADADIVLLPAMTKTLPDWAQVHTESASFDAQRLLAMHLWMPFVNYVGLPSVVFPIGRDARNHPVSVQAIARPYQEHTLLAFAYRHERERYGENGFLVPELVSSIGAPMLH